MRDGDGAGLREVDDVQLVASRVEVGFDRRVRQPGYQHDFRISLASTSPKQNFPLSFGKRVASAGVHVGVRLRPSGRRRLVLSLRLRWGDRLAGRDRMTGLRAFRLRPCVRVDHDVVPAMLGDVGQNHKKS